VHDRGLVIAISHSAFVISHRTGTKESWVCNCCPSFMPTYLFC